MGEKNEFWTTLPGILSGIAGIITALATLLGILYSMGFIGLHQRGSVTEQSPAKVESKDIITSHALKKLENEMAELDRSLEILEKKGKGGLQPAGSLQELQDIRRERENRLEDIENSQKMLSNELEQLHHEAAGNQDIQRKIEQIEGESLPDLESEKQRVLGQIRELVEMIGGAERHREETAEIEALHKKREGLREEIEILRSQKK